jgi:tetratricopeptide (TPR) repeat protein
VTIWFQYTVAIGSQVVRDDSFLSRLAVAGMAVWFYLSKALFPLGLNFVYPRWVVDASSPVSFIPVILLAVLFPVLWLKRREWGRAPLFVASYYVLSLFPILGFFNDYFMRYSYVADHWQYFALPGILASVAAVLTQCAGTMKFPDRSFRLAAGGLVAVLMMLTWNQSLIYQDVWTLWTETLRRNPDSAMAHNNLGNLLSDRGKKEEAMSHWREAIKHSPVLHEAFYNLGIELARRGRTEEAIQYFFEAMRIFPKNAKYLNNLGSQLLELGRATESITYLTQAVQLSPRYTGAHYNLALAYEKAGDSKSASREYQTVRDLDPGFMDRMSGPARGPK